MDFSSKMAGIMILEEIKKDSNKNIVVSPLSFNAILNMIAAGSTGPTLEQMLGFLGSKNINDLNSEFSEFMTIASTTDEKDTDQSKKRKIENQNSMDTGNGNGPTLSFINAVWVSDKFKLKDSYQNLVDTIYKSEARNVDFSKPDEVVKEANAWAKSATKGLITDVLKLSHIEPDTTIILGNALYFKGSWARPFTSERTQDKDFYLLSGGKIEIPFMTGCTKYSYESFEGFQVVQIPYETGEDKKRNFSMYIFLPNERDGLQSLLQRVNLDSEFFTKHTELDKHKNIDYFWIPKFKFEYCIEETIETMKKMGLTLPFDDKCEDLTEMVSFRNGVKGYVSGINHKAIIEIDEKGTEAVAVTLAFSKLISRARSSTRIIRTFIADHPFMFMIREEKSGFVFFTGAVLNPSLNETT